MYKLYLNGVCLIVTDSFYLVLHTIDRNRLMCESRQMPMKFVIQSLEEGNVNNIEHDMSFINKLDDNL
jgi:hypothetical protein